MKERIEKAKSFNNNFFTSVRLTTPGVERGFAVARNSFPFRMKGIFLTVIFASALVCGDAHAAEMVTNGVFSGSTNWSFATSAYDGTTTYDAGTGSAKLATSGRNSAVSGTVTQAVSIPSGSTVSAISLWTQLTTSNETTGDNVSVDLVYADNTTVNILSTGELTNSTWTQRTNSPALTLAQNVTQIRITMNTKSGNSGAATSNLWVDQVSITYTPPDTTPPSSSITSPASGATLNLASPNPYAITGTATDNVAVSGIQVSTDGGSTWNTATCTGCPGASVTWSYSWTLPTQNGVSYTILSKATDSSNNVETPGAGVTVTVDTVTPTVSSTNPANGATNVTLNSNVTITWSENVNCSTVNATNITSTSPGWTLSSCLNNTATFTTSGQANNTAYSVTVSTNVTDSAGNAMASSYAFSYTTVAATCVRANPSVSIYPSAQSVKPGGSVNYTVTVTNNDTAVCSGTSFNLTNTDLPLVPNTNFTASTLGATAIGPLNGGQSGTTTLTHTTASGGTIGSSEQTSVTAADGSGNGHADVTSNTATTTIATLGSGDGNLLKRSQEETCQACHKTNVNTPSVIGGVANSDWGNAIKMHSSEILGTCSNALYKTMSECIDPTKGNGTWTPGKHASSGGWGVTGGVYGVFLCTTCHTAHGTSNIYLIKGAITTPDGSNFLSSATNSVSVDFRVKSGTAAVPGPQTSGIMGDDSVTHSTSVFVCEVCHVYDASDANGVNKHAYNMSVTDSHNNGADCTTCHNHKNAFMSGCTSCHGDPPQDGTIGPPGVATPATGVTNPSSAGAHVFHATTRAMLCEACHTGGMPTNAIPSYTIDMGFALNATNVPNFNGSIASGTLNARAPASPYTGYGTAAGTTVNITTSDPTCSVYCHGSTMGNNNGTATTPSWTAASGSYSCSSNPNGACHGASASNPPLLGSHQKHTGASPNRALPCSDCHNGYVPPAATTTHVNNQSEFAFDTSKTYIGASAAYSGTPTMLDAYGNCSNLYCHSNVQTSPPGGALTYASPTWGNASSGQCGTCHKADGSSGNATIMDSGSHTKHVSTYGFACTLCHNGAGEGTTKHADGNVDVAINGTVGNISVVGSYTGTPAPGDAYGGCSNIYCHSDAQAAITYSNPTWGSSLGCNGCHGDASSLSSGSHSGHLKGATCNNCHNATASSNSAIGTYANHVNGYVTINLDSNAALNTATYNSQNAGGTNVYQKTVGTAYGSCTDIKCHSDGTSIWSGLTGAGSTPTWGPTSVACNTCHGNSTYTSDYRIGAPLYNSTTTQIAGAKPNAHRLHITANTINTGETKCQHCHYQTTTDSATIATGSTTHANGSYTVTSGNASNSYPTGENVSASGTVSLTYTYNAYSGVSTCSNVSCHPTGTTTADNTNTTLNWNDLDPSTRCTDCHKIDLTSNTTYHHSINTEAYTPNTSDPDSDYPYNAAAANVVPQGNWSTGTNPASRKCLMCHVKHNKFSDRMNTNAALTQPRAMNLRTDITVQPTASSGYTNTDFDNTLTNGGICVSCHGTGNLIKDTGRQATETGSTKTLTVTKANFYSSAHQYNVAMTTKTGSKTFNANCVKCHDEQNGETAQFYSANDMGTHDSTAKRLLSSLGGTVSADYEEQFCYRCHSRTTDTVGGTVKPNPGYDWYGSTLGKAMSVASELIYNVFTSATYTFGHEVQNYSGLHKPADEGATANDGTLSGTNRHIECADCHNPHAAQPVASGNATGSVNAYSSGASYDTLTANGTPNWTADQWTGYTVKILQLLSTQSATGAGQMSVIYGNTANQIYVKFATAPGTGSATTGSGFIIFKRGTSDGNTVRGPQNGVWGLNPTWPTYSSYTNWDDSSGACGSSTTTNDATDSNAGASGNCKTGTAIFTSPSTWNRTESATIQGQICIKCHSAYAYGSTAPATASGLPNSTSSTWGNTVGGTATQGDKANEFSPNNLGYHPIFAIGKNQPITANYNTAATTSWNPNWPKYGTTSTTDVLTIDSSGNATFGGAAALPKSVIPGWYVWVDTTGTHGGDNPNNSAKTPAAGGTGYGWFQVVSITDSTHFTVTPAIAVASTQYWSVTAGLGSTFVPPWGPWSTMRCSDCHESDTTTDPMGPHGSATKYLLRKAVVQSFISLNSSGVDTAYSLSPSDTYLFCLNCHRRDVYGDYNYTSPASPGYSRQSHPVDSGSHSLTAKNKWGIVCMNCHGGARTGGIHGENLGKGFNGSGGSYSGKRLLGGSTWYAVTRSTTASAGSCWTKGSVDAVDNCAHSHNGVSFTSGAANYDYDTNP